MHAHVHESLSLFQFNVYYRSPSPCHTFCSTLYIAGRLEPRIPAGSRASSKMETPRPPPPSRLVNLIRLLFSTVAPRHPKTHPFVLVSGEKDVWADVRPVIMVHARDPGASGTPEMRRKQ